MNMLTRPFAGRRLRRLAVASALVVTVAVTAVSAAAVTLPSTVVGSGSDVMFHVNSALDQLYNQSPGCNVIAPSGTQPLDQSCVADPSNPDVTTEDANHDVVSENYPIGGGAGVSQICSQGLPNVAHVDYARQTSPYSSSNCSGLHFVAFARDAVTWEAFPGVTGSAVASFHNTSGACAGVSGLCLTTAQLQGIFVNCTITNWSQVGGANQAIKIYTILPQYGTSKFWYLSLGGGSSTSCGAKAIHQTNNSEIAAADLKGAIVPVSAGSWTERYKAKPAGSALGAIDGVFPTLTTIGNGSFPFGRFLYNVFCAGDPTLGNKCGNASPASAATVRYVGENGWLCKAGTHAKDPITGVGYHTEIQNTIKKYGFSPLPSGATGGGTTLTNFCRLTTHS
jgi:phosphate transport system substrate-binding protein